MDATRQSLLGAMLSALHMRSIRALSNATGVHAKARTWSGFSCSDLLAVVKHAPQQSRGTFLTTYAPLLRDECFDTLHWLIATYGRDELLQSRVNSDRGPAYALAKRYPGQAPNRTTIFKRWGLGLSESLFVDYVRTLRGIGGEEPPPIAAALLGLMPAEVRELIDLLTTEPSIAPVAEHTEETHESPRRIPTPPLLDPQPDPPAGGDCSEHDVAEERELVPFSVWTTPSTERTSAPRTTRSVSPHPPLAGPTPMRELPAAGVAITLNRSPDHLAVCITGVPPSHSRVTFAVDLTKLQRTFPDQRSQEVTASLTRDSATSANFVLRYDRGEGPKTIAISVQGALSCELLQAVEASTAV